MTAMYPRTISIFRPETSNDSGTPQLGNIGYSGEGQIADNTGSGGQTLLRKGVQCSIQGRAMGKVTATGLLPADGPGPTVWVIFIPRLAVAMGTIREHDVVVDDLGYRYHVAADYWNLNGYRLNCIRLEN